MKSILIIFTISVLFSSVGAQTIPMEQMLYDRFIETAISKSIEHDYAAAESAAVELIQMFPDSAAGWFFRAGVINSMMIDYEEPFREADFYAYVDSAIALAEAGIEREPDNPWHYFFRGGALSYVAHHNIRSGRYFPALSSGLKAVGALKDAVRIDSSLYDAYLGLGNYYYWISRRTEFIRWMPFIPNRQEEGIEMIYKAMNRGKYSYESAASALGWVFIDAGRYEDALEVTADPLEKYPESRFFMFSRARSLFELGRYNEAAEEYLKLLKSVRSASRNNHFNEIGILAKISESLVKIGDYDTAAEYVYDGLALNLAPDIRERKSKSIETLKECRRIILEQACSNR